MRALQIRDYAGSIAGGGGAKRLRDAQGNHFYAVRYCGNLDTARAFIDQLAVGSNDGPSSRAADILVVEVELQTDKVSILHALNGGEPVGSGRRALEGKVYEIGARGGLRETDERDV